MSLLQFKVTKFCGVGFSCPLDCCLVVLDNTNVDSVQTMHTVLPAKSDSDVMFCLQSYQGLMIDKSLVY